MNKVRVIPRVLAALALIACAVLAVCFSAGAADYALTSTATTASATIAWTSVGAAPYPGGTIAVTGKLTDASGTVAGQPIYLRASAGGESWAALGDDVLLTTDANGVFSATVVLKQRVTLTALVNDHQAIASPGLVIAPKAKLTTPRMPKSLKRKKAWVTGGYVTITYADGSACNVTVVAERREGKRWKQRAKWTKPVRLPGASGFVNTMALPYVARIKFTKSGTWRVRATTPATAHYDAGASAWKTFKVK